MKAKDEEMGGWHVAVGIACQRWPCMGAEVGPGCKETAFAGAGGAAFDDDNSQCIISSSPMEKHQADIWWSGGSFGVAVPITFSGTLPMVPAR